MFCNEYHEIFSKTFTVCSASDKTHDISLNFIVLILNTLQ